MPFHVWPLGISNASGFSGKCSPSFSHSAARFLFRATRSFFAFSRALRSASSASWIVSGFVAILSASSSSLAAGEWSSPTPWRYAWIAAWTRSRSPWSCPVMGGSSGAAVAFRGDSATNPFKEDLMRDAFVGGPARDDVRTCPRGSAAAPVSAGWNRCWSRVMAAAACASSRRPASVCASVPRSDRCGMSAGRPFSVPLRLCACRSFARS
mmetsp:Transcript_3216/g.7653  ORF Transcript_3216/g.7653 Transcript_3216/m.7653 type:complete len:210 (-) Transcript_3216:238-867(-)